MAGRVVLVTGAGSGIGRAAALLLGSKGFAVGVLGHTPDDIAATAWAVRASGGKAIALTADITSQEQMGRAAGTYLTLHTAVPELKRAGGGSIVVVSSINGTRTFTTPGATAYTATKAGQLAMVQQLALELARYHIRINAVCPGEIETNIDDNTSQRGESETTIPVVWPQGQVPITGGAPGKSEDVAEVIAFLLSDASRHVTGTPVWVDGGQGLLR